MNPTPWATEHAPIPEDRSRIRIVDANKKWVDLGSVRVMKDLAPDIVKRVNAYPKMVSVLQEIKFNKLLQCNCPPPACNESCTYSKVLAALHDQ